MVKLSGLPLNFDHPTKQSYLAVEELVVGGLVQVADELHDAGSLVAHRGGDGEQLCIRRGQGRDEITSAGAVYLGPAGREADRAGAQSLADHVGHPSQLPLGGSLAMVGAPLTHHVGPQCRVRKMRTHVDGVATCLQRVEVLRERLPVPREPLCQGRAGDVLDPLEKRDEPIVTIRCGWREADTAVADRDRGDPVQTGGSDIGVPGDLAVVVGVQVHEAGSADQPVRVDLACCAPWHLPHRDDSVAFGRHVCVARL